MTRNQLLRPVMLFDAATCLAMGGLLVAAAGPIAGLTELPVPLLREAGILLFPFALFVLWAARQGGGWPVQLVKSETTGHAATRTMHHCSEARYGEFARKSAMSPGVVARAHKTS